MSMAASTSRQRLTRPVLLAIFIVGLIIALRLDVLAIDLMRQAGFAELKRRFEPKTWWRALWLYGTLWIWGPVALALGLQALTRAEKTARDRALALAIMTIASAALAGGLADLLKPFLCRMRPEHAVAPATYAFVDFLKNFPKGSGLGLPSSHAAVAWGGALALGAAFPAVRSLALLLALGTCVSRVIVGAHYPSDVLVGGFVGYACWTLVRSLGPKSPSPQPAAAPC